MRKILGVDLDAEVEPLFDNAKPGRILVLDGDGACYRAAATAKTLQTVYRRFIQEILKDLFLTQSEYAIVHITASGSLKANRDKYPALQPYQGNRKNKKKPPLLEPLRYMLSNDPLDLPDNIEIIGHFHWEADDGMIMDSLLHGDSCVVKSDDKDLRMTPAPYWEISKGMIDVIPNRFGWVAESFTDGGSRKVIGHGTKFFWAQMLMGDTADHIRGLERLNGKACAEAGALAFLDGINDESDCANAVLWEFAKHGQNALAEAELLWLRRSPDDSAFKYITELGVDTELRTWLEELNDYHKRLIEQPRG